MLVLSILDQEPMHHYTVTCHLHKKIIKLRICIVPTRPFRAALSAESRVCYPGNTADRQPQWALTCFYLSQSINRKISTKGWFTAIAGIWTCDLRDARAPLWPLGQVPPLTSAHGNTGAWRCSFTDANQTAVMRSPSARAGDAKQISMHRNLSLQAFL
jgi:hypothetical protein